jgi:pimeloyl-ACP methyl ester carboxylesterase
VIEGEWGGRVTGLGDRRVEIAVMRTSDGPSRLGQHKVNGMRMIKRGAVTAISSLVWAAAASAFAAAQTVGTEAAFEEPGLHEVTFDDYSPLAGLPELVRRVLSPLAADQMVQRIGRTGHRLTDRPVDLSREHFAVYVPAAAPPAGYGLLVFVPPWPEAKLPAGWDRVLDRYGFLYVSAAGSGNDAETLNRREPLALLAWHNMAIRYRLDPDRVFIGGFSGGSRVAMRLALAYPDVFHGALLNAGSDPIGDAEIPLPPRDLFERFQSATRLVYVTGERDLVPLGMAGASAASMREWCVFDLEAQVTSRVARESVGHEVADARALAQAFDALLRPSPPDPARLTACRAQIERALAAELARVDTLVAAGQREPARKLLHDIDVKFGGLAAARVLGYDK